jgi:CheY-like chemotaxis protein
VESPRIATGEAAGTPRRVLVVDDNQDAAESLALYLEAAGHEVHTANDGPTALVLAADLLPSAVVLDIGLPGLDGYEVARRLRAMEGMGDAMLIAVSGYTQDADRARSREAGIEHHLPKPTDPMMIAKLIAAVPAR